MMPTDEAAKRDTAAPRVRRGLLWGLAGTAAVFVYLVHANWYLVGSPHVARAQAWLQARAQERQLARQLRQDPPLGARLPDVLRSSSAAHGQKEVSKARIVVFGGPLSACCTGESEDVARVLADRMQQMGASQSVEGVLVLQASAGAVKGYAATQRLDFAVVADEDGSLARAYNAFWTPRVYGLVEGRLRWIQKAKQVNAQEVVQAFSKGKGISSRPADSDEGGAKR
ncbi:MAG: hypothetical protein NZT92_15270 [Abditibacteriales bacterium]|nr:hypothetical protein [Abditibacteriales bacterium]